MKIEYQVFWGSLGCSYLVSKCILYAFKAGKWNFPQAKNYKGETIQTGYGLLFALWGLIVLCCSVPSATFGFFDTKFKSVSLCALLDLVQHGLTLCVFSVGYFDDVRGQKSVKGLSKSIKSFLGTGRLTSNLLKLLVIFICAFSWAFAHQFWSCPDSRLSLKDAVVDAFMIALFANFFNLLDLRPGRAVKTSVLFFIISYVSLLSGVRGKGDLFFFLYFPLIFAAILAYAPLDFRGQAMMGDAGSNMLGFVLGIGYAVILPLPAKVVVVLLLTLFHIYCEFYSFSDFISKNRVLRYLDEFGTCMRKDSKQENKAGSDTGDV